jgi:3-oxoacyl-[acyl-carrier protein] reductase
VNIVLPTAVPVGINEGMPERSRKSLAGKMPSGRLVESKDIANVILFLLSDASSQINGTAISVDGGMLE